MKTILDILSKAGGWHPGLYLKIDNPPYMELVIEAIESPALAVCLPSPLLTTANRIAMPYATRRWKADRGARVASITSSM